jgi:UDP:flavonoid glycosyltransferase YjiC (YdhE family)
MRVLFTTWAWPSHYFPMVPLAWALHTAGHDVRMTSQPDLTPTMRTSGLPCTPIGTNLDVAAVYRNARRLLDEPGTAIRPERPNPPPGRTTRMTDHLVSYLDNTDLLPSYAMLRRLEDETYALFRALWATSGSEKPWRLSLHGEAAQTMVDDLLELARSWRPDLIVYDALTFAGPLVAKLIGVPAVRSLFGPDVTYFTQTTGLTPLLERFGLDDLDLLGAATFDPCPAGLQLPDTVVPTRRFRARYIPYNGLPEVPAWLPDRPHQQPGRRERICLTWGTSIHRLFGEQAFLPGDVLQGCAKLADERDAELILAITANQRHLLPDPPPNVRIVESVPLNALLPTCDALIHQGGAGTMLTALHHGLPQLVLPQLFDEAANAFMLAATGAGQTRAALELTASDLITTGHDLLENPIHRTAAQSLRDEMHHQPTPADIITDLADLAGVG